MKMPVYKGKVAKPKPFANGGSVKQTNPARTDPTKQQFEPTEAQMKPQRTRMAGG